MSDVEDYTPDRGTVRYRYVDGDYSGGNRDPHTEFDRFIAKVKADALREAAVSMRAHKDPGHWNLRDEDEPLDRAASPDAWLVLRADRIEREA